jgi:hypothetical protein
VKHLPADVSGVYEEARRGMAIAAYTSVALCCRKILMNVAVKKGAPVGKTFVEYINFLDEQNHIPRDGKEWLDHIRIKGNDATHEIPQISKSDAEEVLAFAEMLLKLAFEFPERIKSKKP